MVDKILREKLRVERDLLGTAHPFIVTSLTVRRGSEVVTAKAMYKENPLVTPFTPHRLVLP